jgi:LmbE family N-acetylglucosaminyl deacetylase
VRVRLEGRRAVIVAAHPDDETAGLGGCLALLTAPVLVHVTDGAPRDMHDASEHGFPTREAYAATRRLELLDALRAGSVEPAELVALDYVDQEASLHLAELAGKLARLFRRLQPDLVLTHPYEGGHPDHDATAFAVRAARGSISDGLQPQIVEFTSYHNRDGCMETGVFLPAEAVEETIVTLDPDDCARKQRMLHCFRTQQAVLSHFGTTEERFRPAPAYDFGAPPHAGTLFYEQFPWGMTGSRWRELARSAMAAFGG